MHAGLVAVASLAAVCDASQRGQADQRDFMWGAATAAYQIEGSPRADGKQPSVWDEFSKKKKHKVLKGHNGDNADEDYIFFGNKTVPMIQDLGAKFYRLSIAWTRILRNQTVENPAGSEVEAGIRHYKDMFRVLKASGIEPVVTMWHWDTPLALESNHHGFLNRKQMPRFFGEYARTLVKHFGDDVKYWITLNEPFTVATNGYSGSGSHAPGRCSERWHCRSGNSQTEPYLAAHTMILSHAKAVEAIREHPKVSQMTYGIALNGDYCIPESSAKADREAADRCMEFQSGWFFDPIWKGDYPESMKKRLGHRLPKFTKEEKSLVHGTHSNVYFQNIYSAYFVSNAPGGGGECGPYCDSGLRMSREGVGKKSAANKWLYKYPEGIRKYQTWISNRYQKHGEKVSIIVTENGWADEDNSGHETSKARLVKDVDRCNYHRDYIQQMALGVHHDGNKVLGYFPWSLMDNFEWADGYTARFGMTYVDWQTQERTPKMSFKWFAKYVMPLKELPQPGELHKCEPEEFGFVSRNLKVKKLSRHAKSPEPVEEVDVSWIRESY